MPTCIGKSSQAECQDDVPKKHMDVRLGHCSREPLEGPFGAGDTVPESGIYRLDCHDGPPDTVAQVRNNVFPPCERCGKRARYRLVQKAPYILEDPDFAT